ncbi:hypothetical protein XELAEV_18027669mg [Xenopus laevis]|uniref:Uncharacterized protein n=1 Tax=Xenopus laevis TaxID=8355 RepID=A0A974CVX7_XENLA|nr:hypothetical protein XELAEV_18027669mg [Xenopus laevis]
MPLDLLQYQRCSSTTVGSVTTTREQLNNWPLLHPPITCSSLLFPQAQEKGSKGSCEAARNACSVQPGLITQARAQRAMRAKRTAQWWEGSP